MLEIKNYNLIEKDYNELLVILQSLADLNKPYLLEINPNSKNVPVQESLRDSNPEYSKALCIYIYYQNAVLFYDSDIMNRLTESKLPISLKKWFISINDLHNQYEFIISKKIKIDKFAAFFHIKNYLIEKYRYAMQMKYISTVHDNTRIPELTKELMALKKEGYMLGKSQKNKKFV